MVLMHKPIQMQTFVNMMSFGNRRLNRFLRKNLISSEYFTKEIYEIGLDLVDLYEKKMDCIELHKTRTKDYRVVNKNYRQCNNVLMKCIKKTKEEWLNEVR